MSSRSHSVVAAVATFIGLFAVLFVAVPTARADDKDIAQTLRAGDLVIVVRHGSTFPDQADTDPLNFDNIGAQRNLNDKGKGLAKAFGDALRQAGVPIGKVYTSKYNRAYETAVIAGFQDIEKTTDLTEGGLIVSPNENGRRAEACRKMVATAPKAQLQSRREASCAPSTRDLSFRYAMSGSTGPKPAKVPKPQSVPAITRSRPTMLAKRSMRSATSCGCSM